MSRRWGAVGFAGLLVLAACGGGDSDDSAPVIEVQGAGEVAAGSDDGDDAAAAGGAVATDEEQALAFAECMRDNGVDFPDPTLDADGSVDFGIGPGGGGGGGGGLDPQDDGVQDAFGACQSLLEGASFLPGGGDLTEFEDDLLAFAECLRDQGLDVDDPDLDAFGPGAGGDGNATPFGDGFDPNDPANADAIEACQGTFTGGPLGG
ncbi:MAG: hypothetical protein AAFZ07_27305 [Actinomycetota bacterium]